MLFNSMQFMVFFPVVTVLFYALPQRWRWLLLLGSSVAFYMAFIPAYILILAALILIDFTAGILIERTKGKRRGDLLLASIFATCCALLAFKYFDFFAVNATALAGFLHWNYRVDVLHIILPIGLSFHTFQSLSYVIEVYRGSRPAERHLGIYALYVMFYPQLVAGPIERPGHLLPQFREEHRIDSRGFVDGLKLMAWGMFQKVVIADRLAPFVNTAYAAPASHGGTALLAATVFFAFQIYCDFSGYTDIARGAAQVMGFRLVRNFDRPYLARSISEFWRRWHMSLTSWFRDYVYIPLGGNRAGSGRMCLNLMATFLLCGLWHGASWTFILWGALNGAYLAIGALTRGWREKMAGLSGIGNYPRLQGLVKAAVTFSLVCAGWTLFRADSAGSALLVLRKSAGAIGPSILAAFSPQSWRALLASSPLGERPADFLLSLGLIALVWLVDLVRGRGSLIAESHKFPAAVRWAAYFALVLGIMFLGKFGQRHFIYFQF